MNFLKNKGIDIKNNDLLLTALTHSSYANENDCDSYERLEFLGDAVLQLIMSDYFYNNFDLKEGEMSKIRASYVCESALSTYSNEIGLTPNIRHSSGTDGHLQSIVADCFESVLAVIYLEKGFEVAKDYVYSIIVPYIEKGVKFIHDYKSYLQEMTQVNRKTIEYVVVSDTGPAHDRTFVINVMVDGILFGTGTGKSKKLAEQAAAKDAIGKIG